MKCHESFDTAFETTIFCPCRYFDVMAFDDYKTTLSTGSRSVHPARMGVAWTLAHDLWAGSTPSLDFWFGFAALILV